MSTDNAQEQARNLTIWLGYIAEQFNQGKTNEQVVKNLISKGIKQEAAQELVETARNIHATQPNITGMASRSLAARRGWKRMWIGLIFLALGSFITYASYSSAASSPVGGSYTICYGAMIFGGIYFLWGLMGWLMNR
jgi:hypothetical protein